MTELDETIQHVCFILRAARASLLIKASAKGLFTGSIQLQQENISFTSLIPSDFSLEAYKIEIGPKVRAVLVVEKDTVFSAL